VGGGCGAAEAIEYLVTAKFTYVAYGFPGCGLDRKYKGPFTAHHLSIRRTTKFGSYFTQTHGASITMMNGSTLFTKLIADYSDSHMTHSVSKVKSAKVDDTLEISLLSI
jgi:hypothetical protein